MYNDTGSTIPNGTPVYQVGLALGLPSMAPAIASSYKTAIITGVTTMEVLTGDSGLVTTFGDVNDLDTSAFAAGDIIYLSDTVAGGFTNLAPDLASVVGSVLVSDMAVGSIGVRIANNIALPTIFAGLKGAQVPTSLPGALGTQTLMADYINDTSVVMTADKVGGVINCSIDGVYRANISLDLSFDNVGGAGKKEIYLGVRNTTLDVLVEEIKGFILKDAETHSFNANSLVGLNAGESYALELSSEIALTNLLFTQSNFDLESVHIRQG